MRTLDKRLDEQGAGTADTEAHSATAGGATMTYPELRAFAQRIAPGDHETAYAWLNELAATLKTEPLMGHQRRYLYRLRKVWQARATGQDARWEVYGCRAGALPKTPEPIESVRSSSHISDTPAERLNDLRGGDDDALVVEPEAGAVQAAPVPPPPPAPSPLSSILDKY